MPGSQQASRQAKKKISYSSPLAMAFFPVWDPLPASTPLRSASHMSLLSTLTGKHLTCTETTTPDADDHTDDYTKLHVYDHLASEDAGVE